MTKQEFQAMSLPYGLKLMQLRKHYPTPQKDRVVTLDGIADICGLLPSVIYNNEIINFYTVFYRVDESTSGSDSDIQFIPIVRPLSDINKEIEHKGETFVPIVELAKIAFTNSRYSFKLSEGVDKFVWIDDDWNNFRFYFDGVNFHYDGYGRFIPNQLHLFQKLIEWHFDLFGGIESGEAIDVNTLNINPYK